MARCSEPPKYLRSETAKARHASPHSHLGILAKTATEEAGEVRGPMITAAGNPAGDARLAATAWAEEPSSSRGLQRQGWRVLETSPTPSLKCSSSASWRATGSRPRGASSARTARSGSRKRQVSAGAAGRNAFEAPGISTAVVATAPSRATSPSTTPSGGRKDRYPPRSAFCCAPRR